MPCFDIKKQQCLISNYLLPKMIRFVRIKKKENFDCDNFKRSFASRYQS